MSVIRHIVLNRISISGDPTTKQHEEWHKKNARRINNKQKSKFGDIEPLGNIKTLRHDKSPPVKKS